MAEKSPTPHKTTFARPSEGQHPILELMQNIVLPNIERGTGQIVPAAESKTRLEDSGEFANILPQGMHSHDDFEWMCLLGNYSYIKIENDIHRLLPGDFCLLPPRVMHAEMATQGSQPYQALWFTYHAAAVYAQLFSYVPGGRDRTLAHCWAPAPQGIGTLLLMLQAELKNEQHYAAAVRRSLVSTLTHLAMRALEPALASSTAAEKMAAASEAHAIPGFVSRRVLDYLNRHYAENISLEDVARAVHMSRNYLASMFKRETGKTIVETLTEIRVEQAKILLIEGDLSVQAVAHAVGYSTAEHFCRVFSRYEKLPPSRYGK